MDGNKLGKGGTFVDGLGRFGASADGVQSTNLVDGGKDGGVGDRNSGRVGCCPARHGERKRQGGQVPLGLRRFGG